MTNSRSSLTDGVSSYLQIRPLPSYSQEIKKCRLDDIKLNIGGNIIKIEKKVRFLGVIFDREMTWAPHVDYVVARCNKRLNLMKLMAGARWGASKSILLIVYKALIRSVIDYGCIVYDSASDTVKARLDVIQAKALRICCGAMVGTPTSAVQVECGQPPLVLRRLRMASDYAVKIKSIPEHPTASTIDDCWQNHYGDFPAGHEPFGVKVTKTLKAAHVTDVPPAPTSAAPWTHPSKTVLTSYLRPLRVKVRTHITDLWQDTWDYNDTGQFYRDLYPLVSYKLKHQTHPRSKDVQITRLRFGHVQLREKLYLIGQRTDPNCPTCNRPEDVEHYLMECPSQQQLQDQLKARCTAAKRNFTLMNVLAMETCLGPRHTKQ